MKNPIDRFWTSSVEPRLFLLYFLVQVGQGLPWTALSLLLYKEVNLTLEEVNKYYAISYLPWSFKLVYGYISDSLPILKHKRVPYFIFFSFAVCIVFCLFGFVVKSYMTALIMGVCLNACQCGAQLMIDTLVVERVHKETDDEGRGQSLAMASKTAGTVIATILSLLLMLPNIKAPYWLIFCLSGIPYLAASLVALRVNDRVVTKMSFKETIIQGTQLIFCGKRNQSSLSKNRPLFPLLLFLFLRSALPTSSNNVYGYLAMSVSVADWQYNVLNISTSIAALIASLAYSRWLVGKSLTWVIVGTTCVACVTGLMQIYFVTDLFEGVILYWVTIVIMMVNSFASQLAFTPVLIIVSKACPVGFEASVWSVFFSLNDVAGSFGGFLSSLMTTFYQITYSDYTNLYQMVSTCSLLSLTPLLYLIIIRDYFSIIATMADNTAQQRGELSLLKNEDIEISQQKRVYTE